MEQVKTHIIILLELMAMQNKGSVIKILFLTIPGLENNDRNECGSNMRPSRSISNPVRLTEMFLGLQELACEYNAHEASSMLRRAKKAFLNSAWRGAEHEREKQFLVIFYE